MKKTGKILALVLSIVIIITAFPIGTLAKSAAPAKPKFLSFTSTTSTITLKWNKVKQASGYSVYKYNSETKKYTAIKSLSANKYKFTKLGAGETYIFAVKSYKKSNGKKVYSAYSSKIYTTTRPVKVTNLKVIKRSLSSAKLSWKKIKVSGYKIDYSTNKDFKSNVKSKYVTSSSTTISSLSEKTYYFRVYSYKKLSNKKYYSSVSSSVKSEGFNKSTVSAVDLSKKYQTIEGFGASAAWWGHKVGGWENAEDIIKYLYDKKSGIGLNIYRYNVGTGSRDDEKLGNYWARTDGFIESVDFINKTITYDFSKDAEAQNSLKIAKKFAGNDLKVTLFSNSPPVQLTKNSRACSPFDENNWADWGKQSNLEEKNYKLFAQFECDVADYFVSQGYNVMDISPVNEPQFTWACNADGYAGQEGAHYSPEELRKLFKEMVIKADGKPYKVSMFEGGAAEGYTEDGEETYFVKYVNEIYSTFLNRQNLRTISCHSYWADAKGKKACRDYVDSIDPTIDIACTEYCQMYEDVNTGVHETCKNLKGEDLNGYTIDFGVQMARIINEDLTILNSTQWNWWTACSNGIYPDGLVYINDSNHSDIKLTKRLWCLGNYSKFINSGAKRVKIKENQKDLLSSAFLNKDGSLVIVYVNQTDKNKKVNIDVDNYSKYKVYETSKENDLKLMKQDDYNFSKAVSVPAQSVVSVILTK